MSSEGRDLLPLRDVVVCSTSLPQEARVGQTIWTEADMYLLAEQIRLTDLAKQMGAVHALDLTGEVTHLIVGDSNTPKYKYVAKERPDIVVLDPAWIDAVREVWIDGGDLRNRFADSRETASLNLESRFCEASVSFGGSGMKAPRFCTRMRPGGVRRGLKKSRLREERWEVVGVGVGDG